MRNRVLSESPIMIPVKAGISMSNQNSKELAIGFYINKSMNNGYPQILIKTNQNKLATILYNPDLLL
jgi:hypothetical protein